MRIVLTVDRVRIQDGCVLSLQVQKLWSATVDSRHVCVRPVWDNMRLQEELGRPMYILWGLGEHLNAYVAYGEGG